LFVLSSASLDFPLLTLLSSSLQSKASCSNWFYQLVLESYFS
jgi:hypothetical protein